MSKTVGSLLIILFLSYSRGADDLFSDLEGLDIDEQLSRLDDMINSIDDRDIEDGVDSVVNGLFRDECRYACKNGGTPVPRKGHKPTFNGCGTFGVEISHDDLPEMTVCCNHHDLCYDTCDNNRDQCDEKFKTCLENMCEKKRKSLTRKEFKVCKDGALLMYTGTTAFGCTPYLASQENACACVNPGAGKESNGKDKSSEHGSGKQNKNARKEQPRSAFKHTGKESGRSSTAGRNKKQNQEKNIPKTEFKNRAGHKRDEL